MLKKELMECIDQLYDYGKKLLSSWNDYGMQQIRLRSANERKLEESRQYHIEEMDTRKKDRYQMQRDTNYEIWKASPDYDPKKDRRLK